MEIWSGNSANFKGANKGATVYVELNELDSELNVDHWNDNCEAKSEAKSPRPLRGLQVDFSLTRR